MSVPEIISSKPPEEDDDDEDKKTSRSSQDSLSGRTYHLDIIQSPLRSAAFGSNYFSRLPLSPPLVLRLLVKNSNGHYVDINDELPFYVCHCTLLTSNGSNVIDVAHPSNDPESAPVRMLYGSLVTTPYSIRSEVVFPFTDLGIRLTGLYRLQVSLHRLARPGSQISSSSPAEALTKVITDTFEVVEHSQYEAPAPTNLSYELKAAGVPILLPQS